MFSEESTVTKIEVDAASGTVFVRSVRKIMKDGEVIAETLWSNTLYPGDDVTKQDARVVAIAESVWTPEVIAAHKERLQNAQV